MPTPRSACSRSSVFQARSRNGSEVISVISYQLSVIGYQLSVIKWVGVKNCQIPPLSRGD
ncbi:hypothetical protein FXO09_09375 [Microcystis aeruginosa KLA2]|uniref:Uncharacterized protein n=1 Tax=Microcystis aeruginosa DA14 TaxID=1987506 RepID=A0A3E0MJU2_MICAE|nr:MAG: hypothetical protein DWQ56_00535 [Microcystis aeruginosa DA14]TRT98923.1 MAG: hypothetical protein EWV62_07705 [Microcystis aeruginosa Ma_OC_LR_19540900_S633]TYT71451.1 hypothetical protein FXO09_09375 [Microcystis aeruginosa KLA2]